MPQSPLHRKRPQLKGVCHRCSFWGPDGTWDWSQDENQRWVMLQARERGACIFEAFSNSPPFWMTYSGRGSGNRFAWLGESLSQHHHRFYLVLGCQVSCPEKRERIAVWQNRLSFLRLLAGLHLQGFFLTISAGGIINCGTGALRQLGGGCESSCKGDHTERSIS